MFQVFCGLSWSSLKLILCIVVRSLIKLCFCHLRLLLRASTYRNPLLIPRHGSADDELQRCHNDNAHNGPNHRTYAQLQVQQVDDQGYLQTRCVGIR